MEGSLGASSQRQIDRGDNFASNFSGEFGLNYEADLYGKIRDARSAQEFEYQATVQDKEAARLSLVNSVVDLFFNLEYLDNSIALSKVNVKVYQDIRNIMQNKYDNGKIDNLGSRSGKTKPVIGKKQAAGTRNPVSGNGTKPAQHLKHPAGRKTQHYICESA